LAVKLGIKPETRYPNPKYPDPSPNNPNLKDTNTTSGSNLGDPNFTQEFWVTTHSIRSGVLLVLAHGRAGYRLAYSVVVMGRTKRPPNNMYFFPFLDFKMFRSKKYWKNVQTQKNVQS
jgi:hypothetical protein